MCVRHDKSWKWLGRSLEDHVFDYQKGRCFYPIHRIQSLYDPIDVRDVFHLKVKQMEHCAESTPYNAGIK